MTSLIVPHDEKTIKAICKNINLNPQQLDKDIQTLKEWLKTQPHLPQDPFNDDMLVAFLTGCKNSLQRTKQTIDRYLTNRPCFPMIYANRDVAGEGILHSEKVIHFYPLPRATPEGYRVLMCSIINPDPDEFRYLHFIQRALCLGDIIMQLERYHGGLMYVYDLKGLALKHLTLLNVTLSKSMIHCGENSMPIRTKGSFLFNAPSITETMVNIFKPFLKEKTAKRIQIYAGDHTCLYKHIPKEILPYEYGGEAGKIEDLSREWNKYMKNYRDWFLEDGKRIVDESKRPEKSVYKPEQLFGVEGSFKTLSID